MAHATSDESWGTLFKNFSNPNLAKRSKTPGRDDKAKEPHYVEVEFDRSFNNRPSEEPRKPVLRKKQAGGKRPNLHKTSASAMEIAKDVRTMPLYHRQQLSDPTDIFQSPEFPHSVSSRASGMESSSSVDSWPPPPPQEQAGGLYMQDSRHKDRQFSANSAYSGYVDVGPPSTAPPGSANMPMPPINFPQSSSNTIEEMPVPRMRAISGSSPAPRHHRPPPVSTLPPVPHFPPPPSTAPPTRVEFYDSPSTPHANQGFPNAPPLSANGPSSRSTYGHSRAKSSTDLRSKNNYERPLDPNMNGPFQPLPSNNNMPASIVTPARRQTRKTVVPMYACLSL